MKGSRKNRRSKRLPAAHRMLLAIVNSSGSEIAKEIVSTVEISQHGARVRGRRMFRAGSEGLLTQLSSGRQARIRVAWQEKVEAHPGYLDAGVELLNGFDYWRVSFADIAPVESSTPAAAGVAGEAPQPVPVSAEALPAQPLTAQELIENLAAESADRPQVLEALWCGLVDQLEARNALSRTDLIAAIRTLASNGRPPGNPKEKK